MDDRHAYAFSGPEEVVALYDNDIRSGAANLHKWQLEQLIEFGQVKPKPQTPYRVAIVAANGSGKDKFIIAPFCIWFIMSKIDAEVIVTSSSAQQLDNQTEKYIRHLAQSINAKHGKEVLRIIKRRIECLESGSTIRLFATDEPGKAEGYHPLTTNSEMAIVTNETKTIPDNIMEALMRCSGFNYWVEVSSPGQPSGHFYRSATQGQVKFRRVTSYDCPHISKEEIEYDKIRLGESSALFRSKHLALFTSVDQQVVVRRELVDKYVLESPEHFKTSFNRAGLDLGAGGDETVLSVWNGNMQLAQEAMRCEDTERTVKWLVDLFSKYALKPEFIWMDDGGIGRNYFYSLKEKGWPLNRILFQSAAINKREFLNLGAELWWKFGRFFEMGAFKILADHKLIDQLSSRQYVQPTGGKIRLMKKSELKAHGWPSPDRADAAVLANVSTTLDMVERWLGRATQAEGRPGRDTGKRSAIITPSKDLVAGGSMRNSPWWTEDFNRADGVRPTRRFNNPARLMEYIIDI